jgi:hypothetical protein
VTGLSGGLLLPAIDRLEGRVFLKKMKAAKDGRPVRRLQVGTGRKRPLTELWRETATRYVSDIDGVLRICKAAELLRFREVVQYLEEAANMRTEQLHKYRDARGRPTAPTAKIGAMGTYDGVAEFHRLTAEENTLRAVQEALRDL